MLVMEQKKKAKPNRKGIALNTFLPSDLGSTLEKFIQDQPVEPKKTTVVQKALREYFVRLGYLAATPGGKPMVPVSSRSVKLPFVGPVAAGTPLVVFDNPHETFDLAEAFGGEGRYIFEVRGDSMVDEKIFDGDRVIVQRNPAPKVGDVVVARFDGALTLKKLIRRTEKETRLAFCNGEQKSLVLDYERGDDLLGKYVVAFRKPR